jgi:toxin ParE1/3/4
MASFRVSNAAKADIHKIGQYTQKQWGKDKRRQYLTDFQDKFTLLGENPLMVREDESFTPPVRLCPHAQHLIVYTIDDYGVFIVRVLHGSMNIADHL